MEAFELDIYASEYNELAFTLHKRKFSVELADEMHLSLDDISMWFNIDNRRLKARRKLDARDSKLEFFRERSGYGECRAYTYNVVMNAACERLSELEIPINLSHFRLHTRSISLLPTSINSWLIRCWWLITASNSAPRKKLISLTH